MNKQMLRRLGAAVMTMALALSLLSGCAEDTPDPTHTPTPTPTLEPTPTPEPTETPEPTADPANDPQAGDLDSHGDNQDENVTSGGRERPYSEERYNEVVQQVLDSIITDGMTTLEQCRAIYDYVKGHVYYTGSSDKSDWKQGAYSGFVTGRGDCFTYYACSRALLTALDIDNLEVQRYGSSMPTRHYWNLVDYGEGWYHFDACPHLLVDPAFECFMATDQELLNFDAGAGREYYSFDADAYPERVGGPADPDAVVPMPDRRPKPTATVAPTVEPTVAPTVEPTTASTAEPAVEPTAVPTAEPAVEPTTAPVTTPAPEATPAPEVTPAPQVSAEPAATDTPVQTPEAQGEGQSQGENADAQ